MCVCVCHFHEKYIQSEVIELQRKIIIIKTTTTANEMEQYILFVQSFVYFLCMMFAYFLSFYSFFYVNAR